MSLRTGFVGLPEILTVDPRKDTKAIYIHPDDGLFIPGTMRESYRRVDDDYKADKARYLGRIVASLRAIPQAEGAATVGYFGGTSDDVEEAVVVLSPLNDGVPESSVAHIASYVQDGKDTPSKGKAQPNSWRPAAKTWLDYELGSAEGLTIPRAQLFAPEARAMTKEQKARVADGDMTPYGELISERIAEIEKRRSEELGKKARYNRLHFFAAGMGAKALGAALHLSDEGYEVGSVTLMNFALGEQRLAELGAKYAQRRLQGEASSLALPPDYMRVPEFQVLQDLDKNGAEFAMRIRQINALRHIRMVRSVMDAENGVGYIEALLRKGAVITIANAVNESITAQTDYYLPVGDGNLHRMHIVGVEGQKVGMMANEHGAALAAVSNTGLANYHKGRKAV